ncbi:MAG: hypothetical protein CMJ58_23235 [Planctomycetaceae bacterium]|nr:hypothetical protein [Planctomycetaceae bacterium]
MPTLHNVIKHIRNGARNKSDWLYIVDPAVNISLCTEAELGCPEYDEERDEEIDPEGFADRGLQSTIDVNTVAQCITWGDRLSGCEDDEAAADVIRYYIRFDAWPDALNSPDPSPPDVAWQRHAQQFVDKLGPEDSTKECRHVGCTRGVVQRSVFCRLHHFENIHKRPYPLEE